MVPYKYLIEVAWLDDQWVVVESDSKGDVHLWGEHRWYWLAARFAHRLAKRRLREQGDQLRLEVWYFDKDGGKPVKRFIYGKDPRSVS